MFWPSSVNSAVSEINPTPPAAVGLLPPEVRGTIVVLGGTCCPGGLAAPLPSRPEGGACTCQLGAACWAAAGGAVKSHGPGIDRAASRQHRGAAAPSPISMVCMFGSPVLA